MVDQVLGGKYAAPYTAVSVEHTIPDTKLERPESIAYVKCLVRATSSDYGHRPLKDYRASGCAISTSVLAAFTTEA